MNTIVTVVVNELQLQGQWSGLGTRLGHSDVLLGNKVQGVKYRTSCLLEMYHVTMMINTVAQIMNCHCIVLPRQQQQ